MTTRKTITLSEYLATWPYDCEPVAVDDCGDYCECPAEMLDDGIATPYAVRPVPVRLDAERALEEAFEESTEQALEHALGMRNQLQAVLDKWLAEAGLSTLWESTGVEIVADEGREEAE